MLILNCILTTTHTYCIIYNTNMHVDTVFPPVIDYENNIIVTL